MDLAEASPLPRVGRSACPVTLWTARIATAWRRALRTVRRSGAAAATDSAVARLAAWHRRPQATTFPYDAVIAEMRRAGKHFASRELLASLAAARSALPQGAQDTAGRRLVHFLATALDKWDDRYDNPSYLALDGLALPRGPAARAAARRDHVLALLIADALGFELAAADGRSALQPEMRPPARTTEKRCRHGLLVLAPVLARRGLPIDADGDDPVEVARSVVRRVFDEATDDDERMLQLTLLPVSRVHDECLFIRVLQAYETTFAYTAVELAEAAAAISNGNAAAAVAALDGAASALGEAAPLFSLIGTMQPQAFLTFRQFTDGASAIQSRNYKLMESACRTPDGERIDSPAYLSVPEVRAAVLAGRPTIDRALQAAHLPADQETAVRAAMERFASALTKWRRTHHSVAGRMLGERRGTGDTAGQEYLAQGMRIPVFAPRCPLGHDARAADPRRWTSRSREGDPDA